MAVDKFKKNEFKYTIFGKMVFSFTILLSASLLFLGLIISNVTKKEVKNQYIKYFKSSIESDKKYVDYVMNTLDSLSIQILQDKELIKTIITEPKDDLEKIELERSVTKSLTKIRISNEMINSIYLINPKQNSAGYPEISSFKDKFQDLVNNDYYKRAVTLGGESLWIPPHANILSQKGDIVISNVRFIKDILTDKEAGVLFINIKPESIIVQPEKEIKGDIKKMVIDKEKFILAHTDLKMIGKNASDNAEIGMIFDKITIALKKNGETARISDSVIYNFEGEKMFGYYSYSNQSKLLYMNIVPYSILTQTANKLSTIIFGMSLGILALTILSAIIISFSISRPIKILTLYCDEMSDGNFTKEVPKKLINRNDEIGRLAAGFKKIGESVTSVISDINGENKNILNISMELNKGNKNLMDRVSSEAANIVEISSTMDEINHNINNNLNKVNKLSTFILNTAEKLKTTKEDSDGLMKAISEIKESSIMIKEMLEVIEDVAFQTNLLALNSTVEAARAGNAGLGFAVVALEIRALANRTKNSVKNISTLITNSENKNLTGELFINKTLENMNNISKEVINITSLITDINKESQEQAEGIKEITQSIGTLEDITQNNSNMSEEILDISNVLKEGVVRLSKHMLHFKLHESND